MKIFVIHSMGMSKDALEYAEQLESEGHETFVPVRDTEQFISNVQQVLESNRDGLIWCDEAHVIWDLSSMGTIFDMGTAFALEKPIKIIRTKRLHWSKFIPEHEGEYIL